METKRSKSRAAPTLQQPEYFDSCSTAAEVETRFGQLIRYLEEQQPLSAKLKKQLCRTAQFAIPRLLKNYKTIPAIAALLATTGLLMVMTCDYQPMNWQQFMQQTLEPLANPRVQKGTQMKLATMLVRSTILVEHYSHELLNIYFECMAKSAKNYREVRMCLSRCAEDVLMSKNKSIAMESLMAMLRLISEQSVRDLIKGILQSERLRDTIDDLLMRHLEQKKPLQGILDIIKMNIHITFIGQISRMSYDSFLLSILRPIISQPQLSYFLQFFLFYKNLVKDPELSQEVLLNLPAILALRQKIQQSNNQQRDEKAVYNLEFIANEIQQRYTSIITSNSHFFLKLQNTFLAEPTNFTLKFYKALFGVEKIRNKLYQIIGIILNKAYCDNKEVWEFSYSFIDLYVESLLCYSKTVGDFKYLLAELNYHSFMKITTHLYSQYFKETLDKSYESRLRIVQSFFAEGFFEWRKLTEGILNQSKIVNWMVNCSILRQYMPQWLERHTQSTFDFLKTEMSKRNIRAITAFWNLLSHLNTKPQSSRSLVPYLANNFDGLISLFSEKESAFNKIMYHDGIQWNEHYHKTYLQQRQLQKKMSKELVRSILRVLAHTNHLHRYLPENVCPQNMSERLLKYLTENPNNKVDLQKYVLRIMGKLEPVSSMHFFAQHVFQPLRKMDMHRHSDLTAHATCLRELVIFKLECPQLSMQWPWKSIEELIIIIMKLNTKDFSMERDVLRAKILALQASQAFLLNTKDTLFLKQLFEHTIKHFEINYKSVSTSEMSVLNELRCEVIRTIALLIKPLAAKHKKLSMEFTHLMQTAIIDESEEVRLALIKLIIESKVKQPIFLMLIALSDTNQTTKQVAKIYTNEYFEHIKAPLIGDLLIHLMFFLHNSIGVNNKEMFIGNFVSMLNEKSVSYAIDALQVLRNFKVSTCNMLAGQRTIYGRKNQPSQTQKSTDSKDSFDIVQHVLTKRAKTLKVKGTKLHRLILHDHHLLD